MKRHLKRFNKLFLTLIIVLTFTASIIGCSKETGKEVEKQASNTTVTSNVPKKTPVKTVVNNSTSTLKIHYIDVGQADSILVEQDKHFMLIDAGTNCCEGLVVDYLKKAGVTKLDYAIGTHPHEDHIGGLDKVIDNFNIGTLLMPKKIANTKTFKDVLVLAKNKGLKITQPVIGTNYNLGKATFTILAPKNHDYESTNNYSIVQKLKFGNTSFIFTGDAEAISEMEMVNANLDLQADVLKVGHHGSKTSTCQAFLDKVNPKYAVISCGKDNKYKHPNKSTMDRLKGKNIPVYRTDENGTIIATSDGEKITFNASPGSYDFRDNAQTPKTETTVVPTKLVVKNPNTGTRNNLTSTRTHKKHNVSNVTKSGKQVWLSATGSKYHSIPNCGRMNPNTARKIPLEEAKKGYDPCSKCM